MHPTRTTDAEEMTQVRNQPTRSGSLIRLGLAACATLALLLLAPAAQASKQAIDFFGGEGTLGGQFGERPDGAAVNNSGTGPANPGDVYALDAESNRIERFGRDDNGTPANLSDDTYSFISAWGGDVVQSGGSGDIGDEVAKDYEVCTVASQCKAGVASSGNGTVAGGGTLSLRAVGSPPGIALDQDTGQLYVSDTGNNRVNVYAGDGAFLRSFGYDVIASGPDDAGTGYEVCVALSGDVCKAGLRGSAPGQIGTFTRNEFESGISGAAGIAVSSPDANPGTGTVFLADGGNRRVDTYGLDGSGPSSFGSGHFPEGSFSKEAEPTAVAVDSRGIVYAAAGQGFEEQNPRIERYDSQNANGGGIGFLAPILSPQNEVQILTSQATAGQFRLTFGGLGGQTTSDLSYAAGSGDSQGATEIEAALEALSSIGPGNVRVNARGSGFGQKITFKGPLASTDLEQLTVTNGTTPLTGSVTVTTPYNGHPGLAPKTSVAALAIDPDEDGGGPETDVLYAERQESGIQQFGPLNPPGLTVPPSAVDDTHGTSGAQGEARGFAVEPSTGRLYTASNGQAGPGVYVLDNTGPPATASMDSIDGITSHSAELHATINPNGLPASHYHFEYSLDGIKWVSTPEVFLGAQETPQAVSGHLQPPPLGLDPNTEYHVRVVDVRKFAALVTSNELTFTTTGVSPLAETDGAPVRTTTTAQLNGRVTPLGSATTYHFEYGTEGPCDVSPCASTPNMLAGSAQLSELVGEEITGLNPDTTYHYRLVDENGVGSPVAGADMTVHTRASNVLPNQDDKFPGPPGSDRAWEQVSIPDSSGNPVGISGGFSDAGDRAVYGILGGTPISSTGNLFSTYFAQRPPGAHPKSGWHTSLISPPRDQLAGAAWHGLYGPTDLSQMISFNEGSDSGTEEGEIWHFNPGGNPSLLFERATTTNFNAYDITINPPHLLSLLPGDAVSPCGVSESTAIGFQGSHWISDDGSLVYFQSQGAGPCGPGGAPPQLYVREVDAGQSKLISGPLVSGPLCEASLIKATATTTFFATQSRLDPADTEAAGCGTVSPNGTAKGNQSDRDVYRYDLSDGSFKCITCVIPGFGVDVTGTGPTSIAVADDGSRVYFSSPKRLLPGAPASGGVYRVNVESGDLAYIASISGGVGNNSKSAELSPDGRTLAFSSSSAALNPLGGTTNNGGGTQYYRYDDSDRSLVCFSCPQDGSAPLKGLVDELYAADSPPGQPNRGSLAADGQTIAFSTPTPMVGADQNTPGPGGDLSTAIDVYEWRDGRLVLVSDGLTNWTGAFVAPQVQGITPSGHDIFFTATARYTQDAPDALRRLYDARIGGGIDFPPAPQPCPLEVCQGTPKGAPEEQEPASRNFSGLGNQAPESSGRKCPKGKRRVKSRGKTRCVAPRKPNRHRAKHNRRASR